MESKENVFLKTPWSLEELSVVEEGVKGKTIAQSIIHLKGLLPNRSVDAIRTRVYEFTLEDRTNKRLEKAKKAIEKKKLLANLEDKIPEETEIFKENVIDEEEMVITSIEGDLKTKSQAMASNGPKLAYTDELIVKQGVISVPFMGEVRCNFRITGTFFIEKLD
jgi:hypothetical protein